MKTSRINPADFVGGLAIATLLILTAWGNAMAMLIVSLLALLVLFIWTWIGGAGSRPPGPVDGQG